MKKQITVGARAIIATSNEPEATISGDNGQTFGQLLRLSANGTIRATPQ